MPRLSVLLALAMLPVACSQPQQVTRAAPELTPIDRAPEQRAMMTAPTPVSARAAPPTTTGPSLWAGGRSSLLGDRRALEQGDILTVVIEIDERAEISNSAQRQRASSENLGMPSLFGLPGAVSKVLPGVGLENAVGIESGSSASGDGSVSRNEKLELRVAAVVTGVLPNGVLEIRGSQEVRVNYEMRELLVTGYVRPMDISRQNEITYDKIASARISYGGRGQITEAQAPRRGQRVLERVLPF